MASAHQSTRRTRGHRRDPTHFEHSPRHESRLRVGNHPGARRRSRSIRLRRVPRFSRPSHVRVDTPRVGPRAAKVPVHVDTIQSIPPTSTRLPPICSQLRSRLNRLRDSGTHQSTAYRPGLLPRDDPAEQTISVDWHARSVPVSRPRREASRTHVAEPGAGPQCRHPEDDPTMEQ
jgi:hypothetical protein